LITCKRAYGASQENPTTRQRNHWDLSDPKIKQTLQEPLTEAAKIIFSADKPGSAIVLQPEFFTSAIGLYCQLDDIPWSQVEDAANRGVLLDPNYVPLYIQTLVWLATRPPEVSATLPKPLDWITEILKVEPDDQKDTADQKAKTYAQALAFRNQRVLPLQVQQTDWPTLKRGLAFLVHSYPKSTEWATRYLILSYAMKDPAATKEALDVLQGNYNPRVIGDPGNSTITNFGSTDFFASSTAGNSTIATLAGGVTTFHDTALGGAATITIDSRGVTFFTTAAPRIMRPSTIRAH
jgi:hypothetical protein